METTDNIAEIKQLAKERKQLEGRRRKALATALDTRIQLEDLEQMLSLRVSFLRIEGASWGQIAKALGVSRQAAQQRFGRQATPVSQ